MTTVTRRQPRLTPEGAVTLIGRFREDLKRTPYALNPGEPLYPDLFVEVQ